MEQHPERVHPAAVLDRPAAGTVPGVPDAETGAPLTPRDETFRSPHVTAPGPARSLALDALDRAEVSLGSDGAGAAKRGDLAQMERLEPRAKFAGYALT